MTRVKLSDADRVAETACDVKFEKWPDWSVDELLCHPDEAKTLCVEVRRRMTKKLSDYEICHALLNARKRGKVLAAGSKA